MKVYITKYALTQGIIERDDAEFKGNMCCIPGTMNAYYHGPEWHRDKDSAVARASEMLHARIKSLEKSIRNLKAMDDDIDWPMITKTGDGQ